MSKDILGSVALAEIAGPMRELMERCSGAEGHKHLQDFKRFLRKQEVARKKPKNIPVLKTVRTGVWKSNCELRASLSAHKNFDLNVLTYIVAGTVFLESHSVEAEHDIVAVTGLELGLEDSEHVSGCTIREITRAGIAIGLRPLTLEMVYATRLAWLDQPRNPGDVLTCIDPLRFNTGEEELTRSIFLLERYGPEEAAYTVGLRPVNENPENPWALSRKWLFEKPRH